MPPITLALSLQRSRSVPQPVVLEVQFSHSPGVVDRADNFPAFGRWLQTHQYCNPIPGSPLWVLALVTWPLLSCGRWFLTHWRHPQSALDRWCLWLLGRSVLKPKLLDAWWLPFVSSPALLHKLQVISKIPKLDRTRQSPIVALTSSRNQRLIIH